jgi:uncharacterized membrane protein
MLDALTRLLDPLLTRTSLPNLHPAVIHFPIALLLTAALFDLACLLFRRQLWMDRSASALYLLGTLCAGASYVTGLMAAQSLSGMSGVAEAAMWEHRDIALLTLIAFTGVTVLRVFATWLARRDKVIQIGPIRLLAVAAALGAQALLVLTADRGGALVFRHELGIDTVQQRALDRENLEP